MSTDEQLIERLSTAMRAEVAELEPPRDLMRRLREDLSAGHGDGLRWRPSFGGLVAAAGSLVAIALAAVVLTVVGHSGSQGAGSTVTSGSGLRTLVADLAVLRRAQRPQDRLPAAVLRADPYAIPALSRLVRTVPLGEAGRPLRPVWGRIYLIVSGSGNSYGIGLLEVHPPNGQTTGAAPVALPPFLRAGALHRPDALMPLDGQELAVVPDGVTRVRWRFTNPAGPGQLAPSAVMSAGVRDNVASVPQNPDLPFLASAVWYDASGRVVAEAGPSPELAASRRALGRSEHEPLAPPLSAHFGLFRSAARVQPLPQAELLELEGSLGTLNVAQARYVPYRGVPGLRGIWAVPGRRDLALLAPGASGVTGHRARAAAEGSFWVQSAAFAFGSGAPQLRIITAGLVPDGNATVTLALPDGTTRTARVIDNVYAISLPVPPVALTDRDSSGRLVTHPFSG